MIFVKPSLLKAAYSEIEDLRQQIEIERAARINAEVLASERAKEVERTREEALRFEKAYVESIHERLTSLDQVNVMLMREQAPQSAGQEPHAEGASEKIEIDVKRPESRISRLRGKTIQNRLKQLRTPAGTGA
jgi:hypothetical protein